MNIKLKDMLNENTTINKTVVVYPGRFQPFHAGHYASYMHLVKKFGRDNVYIATSDKIDAKKSPFNFKEKVLIMVGLFGIPKSKIVQVKNPYAPTEILKKYDETTTGFVTVVGEKDASRLGGKYFTPYTGNVEYGYKEKGYVYVSPSQAGALSGTKVREMLSSGTVEERKKRFTKIYPKFNETIFNMIIQRLEGMK
jgi:hypothetical protein